MCYMHILMSFAISESVQDNAHYTVAPPSTLVWWQFHTFDHDWRIFILTIAL